MDIYTLLKQDHDEVKDMLGKIQSARSADRRGAMVRELKHNVLLHAKTEEATFYARLRQEPELAKKLDHAKEEHAEVEQLFNQISRARSESSMFFILFGQIKLGLEHHIREEEEEIFKKARQILSRDEAVQLAEEMQALKERRQAA